jgi:hypothetical protein
MDGEGATAGSAARAVASFAKAGRSSPRAACEVAAADAVDGTAVPRDARTSTPPRSPATHAAVAKPIQKSARTRSGESGGAMSLEMRLTLLTCDCACIGSLCAAGQDELGVSDHAGGGPCPGREGGGSATCGVNA